MNRSANLFVARLLRRAKTHGSTVLGIALLLLLLNGLFYQFISNDESVVHRPDNRLTETASESFEIVGSKQAPFVPDQTTILAQGGLDASGVFGDSGEDPASPLTRTIYGHVVDDRGRGIDQVLISDSFGEASTRSDADGAYSIRVVIPKFRKPWLNFLRSGYQGRKLPIPVDPTDDSGGINLDASLNDSSDSITLSGWISNPAGAGLAERKIKMVSRSGLGFSSFVYSTSSDDLGDFSFEGIRSGLPYKLEVPASSGYSGYVTELIDVSKSSSRLNIVLEPIRLIDRRGRVVNRQGDPIAGFLFNAETAGDEFPIRKLTTDSSGFFSLEQFPTGDVSFSSPAPEYIKISGIKLRPDETADILLLVDKGDYYLSGWVSDENGMPLENARVTLDAHLVTGELESYSYRSVYTNNAGTFTFTGLGALSHLIRVYAEGYPKTEVAHRFRSPAENIHIVVTSK